MSEPTVKRIAHILWSFTTGGVETMLVNIANGQAERGRDVAIFIVNDRADSTLVSSLDSRIRFVNIARKPGSHGFGFVHRLNRELDAFTPDVIHLHGSVFITMLKRCHRRRAVMTLHDIPSGRTARFGLLGRIFPPLDIATPASNTIHIRRVGHIFAISRSVQRALLERYGLRSEVVYNGIDTRRFRSRGDRQPGPTPRLVQIGRLNPEKKGQDLLLEAVARLEMAVQVDFIGDGPGLEQLREMAERLGIAGRVNFLGNLSRREVAERLAGYDVMVQPSRREGFGLTVAEAMAAGVPVIVSSGEGPQEITDGDRYGTVFETGNAAALATAVSDTIKQYDNALDKALTAQSYVRNTFDIKTTIDNYLAAYEAIAGQ